MSLTAKLAFAKDRQVSQTEQRTPEPVAAPQVTGKKAAAAPVGRKARESRAGDGNTAKAGSRESEGGVLRRSNRSSSLIATESLRLLSCKTRYCELRYSLITTI